METLIQISLSLKTFWMFFMTPSSISVHFRIVISDRNRNKIGPYHLLEKSSSWASVSVFENWPLNFDSCFSIVLDASYLSRGECGKFYIIIVPFLELIWSKHRHDNYKVVITSRTFFNSSFWFLYRNYHFGSIRSTKKLVLLLTYFTIKLQYLIHQNLF